MKNIICATTLTIIVATILTIIPLGDFGKVYATSYSDRASAHKDFVVNQKRARACLDIRIHNDDMLRVTVDNERCDYRVYYNGYIMYNNKSYNFSATLGDIGSIFYWGKGRSKTYNFSSIPRAAWYNGEVEYKDCAIPTSSFDQNSCKFDSNGKLPSRY